MRCSNPVMVVQPMKASPWPFRRMNAGAHASSSVRPAPKCGIPTRSSAERVLARPGPRASKTVSYTHLRAHETDSSLFVGRRQMCIRDRCPCFVQRATGPEVRHTDAVERREGAGEAGTKGVKDVVVAQVDQVDAGVEQSLG